MGYLVWTKSDFEGWGYEEVDSLEEAKGIILESEKAGQEVILAQIIPFTLEIVVPKELEEEQTRKAKEERHASIEAKKEVKVEVTETKSSKDKGA